MRNLPTIAILLAGKFSNARRERPHCVGSISIENLHHRVGLDVASKPPHDSDNRCLVVEKAILVP
jgi:hypothetical protein